MSSKILIVDDEAPIRTLLRASIATSGLTVFEADCGVRALEIAKREGPFGLVITDVLMPGMDGFELAAELARAGQASTFLFVSGYVDSEDMAARLRAFPSAGFLSKPFPVAEFIQSVRRLLASQEALAIETHRRRA